MKYLSGPLLGLFLILSGVNIAFGQTATVRLEVTVPPGSVTDSTGVLVAGSFNCWNALDSLYLMKKLDNNSYFLLVPLFDNHKYEYKYAAGGWNNVEVSEEGKQINNRVLVAHDGLVVRDTVLKWNPVQIPQQVKKAPVLSQEQMKKLFAFKEDLSKKLESKMKSVFEVLKMANENMLSENPDQEMRKVYHNQIVAGLDSILDAVTDVLWQAVSLLTPEQKKEILDEIHSSDDPGAIFNWISNAQETPKK